MGKSNWTFEQLKLQLSRKKEIKAWIVTEEHVHRRERYFMSEGSHLATDQDRNIHSRNIVLKLFVHLPKEGRQGEITKKLFSALPLEEQIDHAIEAAMQTDHQSWELPQVIPAQIPDVMTADPKIAESIDQVMGELTHRIERAIQKKRPAHFNSSELFLSVHHRELHLSNGLTHRSSQSRIYCETAFSYSKPDEHGKIQSDEYLSTQWSVPLAHLPIEELFDQTAECAEHSLDVVKPQTGKYAVIIDAEVLSNLLNGQLSQLTAFNAYHGLPYLKPGGAFIPESHGDLLSITLDPTLDFGANSGSLSGDGLIQTPLKLVEENQVIATATDKQYGDYLSMRPTTSRGNILIDAGKMSHQELTYQAPVVIEILQFSGLFTDPNSGTFSSEIRLAKLYDNATGKVSYIKGGSLSGSIIENFKGLRLSKTRVNRAHFSSESSHGQGYYGPEYALLTDVSIVG